MTLRVGLTGGLASGKSTVARRWREMGIPVLDADLVVHELYEPGGAGAAAVAEAFGADLLDGKGAVDRPRLARRVFGDGAAVKTLNARIHPLVIERQAVWFEELEARGEPLAVVEATLLLESGGRKRFDRIVTVSAPAEVRLARAIARDPGVGREQLGKRMAAQMPDAERDRLADHVLRSDGTRQELIDAATRLGELLRAESRGR